MSKQSAGATQAYTVLARRFRPQGFADVVGQEHVSKALKNAIKGNRVAHAYLFTGARGVGKTSTARILAKALNCPKSIDGNPCNDCEICNGISAGNDVDVLEIDGASNNGVDDIRQLRANVNVMSMRTQYKVYIIDEVHMLSKGAFNALLKTLEEPPPNVKFVFCTTEPNKVPDTILSRCQRFDFGTIETNNIKGRLAEIATAEGVEVDDEALELVARRAAGSMRDSQSLFDQLLAFGEEQISAEAVHRLLGTAADDRLVQLVGSLIERDQAAALAAFHQALDDGVQLGELTDQLLFYLRDLMILATGAKAVELLAVAPGSRDVLAAQANGWGLQTIVSAMQILADTKGRMQRVTYGRALAELALVRIGLLEELTDLNGLVERLRSAEPMTSQVSSGSSDQKKSNVEPIAISAREIHEIRGSTNTSVALAPHHQGGVVAVLTQPQQSSSGIMERSVPVDSDASVGLSIACDSDDQLEDDLDSIDEYETYAEENLVAQLSSELTAIRQPERLGAATQAQSVVSNVCVGGVTDSDVTGGVACDTAETAPEIVDSVPTSTPAFAFRPENADAVWAQVVSQINDMLKSHVKAVTNAAIFAPNRLEITFPKRYNFSKQFCEKPDALGRLEKIASALTGQSVRISLVVSEDSPDVVDQQKRTTVQTGKTRVYKPETDLFVACVMESFGAQCVKVTPIQISVVESSD